MRWLLLSVVPILLLTVPEAALALTIQLPAEGAHGELDVVPHTEALTIVTDTFGASCSVYDGATQVGSTVSTSTAVTDPYPPSQSGYMATVTISGGGSDDAEWHVDCTSGAAADSQSFFVVADTSLHRQIFLDTGTIPYLASQYDGHRPDFTMYYYGPSAFTDGNDSVRDAGWWYLLSVSDYGDAEGPNGCGAMCGVPKEADMASATSVTTPTAGLVDGSNGIHQERLALSSLLAHAYNDCCSGSGTVDGNLILLEDDYQDAATYWGITTAQDDWTSTGEPFNSCRDGNAELVAARNLAGSAVAYDWMWPNLTQQERHDWLAGLTDKESYFVDTFTFASDTACVPSSNDLSYWSTLADNAQARDLRNGHYIEPWSAIGITAMVLDTEMNHGSTNSDWTAWRSGSDAFFDALLAVLPDDGADHSGVDYWEQNTSALLQYMEAQRTLEATDWDSYAWFEYNEEYLRAMTDPDGERVMLGDSDNGDFLPYPSAQMARLAATYSSSDVAPFAQQLSWDGLNTNTPNSSGKLGERDVWDLLWWDDSIARADVSMPAPPSPHQCFAQSGLISLTSGDTDPTHFVFRGGPIVGGHDDPDVGSFTLYKHGHLVGTDGINNVAKHTATQSTLIVDGWGQHGDGYAGTAVVPEGSTNNNARRLPYLDALGRDKTTGAITGADIVTAGVDLTSLYQVVYLNSAVAGDSHDTDLTSLHRWFVWVPGAITLYDPYTSSNNNARVDWNLQTAVFTDVTRVPQHCPVAASGSYYAYHQGASALSILYNTNGTVSGTSSSLQDLNVDLTADLACVSSGTCGVACPAWKDIGGGGFIPGATATIAANSGSTTGATGSGRLQVDVEDSASTNLERLASPYGDGSSSFGWRYSRHETGSSGSFLTLLRPYVDGGSSAAATHISSVSGGEALDVGLEYIELFKAASAASVSFGSPTTSTDGTIGVFQYVIPYNNPITHDAMQIVGGTSLVDHGTSLISANHALNLSGAVNSDQLWGTVSAVSAPTTITVNINGAVTSGTGSGSFTPPGASSSTTMSVTYGASGATFTVTGDGTFVVPFPGHSAAYEPASTCF